MLLRSQHMFGCQRAWCLNLRSGESVDFYSTSVLSRVAAIVMGVPLRGECAGLAVRGVAPLSIELHLMRARFYCRTRKERPTVELKILVRCDSSGLAMESSCWCEEFESQRVARC